MSKKCKKSHFWSSLEFKSSIMFRPLQFSGVGVETPTYICFLPTKLLNKIQYVYIPLSTKSPVKRYSHTQIKKVLAKAKTFFMGRVVGLSWIFCVKRVYVFCRRDLHHLAKALRTLLAHARTLTKLRLVGFV